MDMQAAGKLFQKYRKDAHLTQSELAKMCKMSRSTISLIESGAVQEIGLRKFTAVCEVIGLSVTVTPEPKLTWEESQKRADEIRAEEREKTNQILK